MDRNAIVESIGEEIRRLQKVRDLLSGSNSSRFLKGGQSAKASPIAKKRVLSEEARSRIAQAQKRRWAKHRKETAAAA